MEFKTMNGYSEKNYLIFFVNGKKVREIHLFKKNLLNFICT